MRGTAMAAAAFWAGAAVGQDAEEGGRLARRWCADCHVVGSEQERGGDAAPAVAAIAEARAGQEAWLAGWLSDPHPPMPDLGLSRRQIEDVIAYLDSLRRG